MIKRTNFRIYSLLIMGVSILFASSCKKVDDNEPSLNNPTNGKTTAVFNPNITYGTMTDQEGNVYKTVTIGTQTWMAENLRTTKYNDGTAIPNVTDYTKWGDITTDAYCNYNNTNNTDTIATYGRLYNWSAVSTGKLAPKGWHVPTDAEWIQLTDYLSGISVAGGKLKETGTSHWSSPNTGATNVSGFTALPGGLRAETGLFISLGSVCVWWAATEYSSYVSWGRVMYSSTSDVTRYGLSKWFGISARCVKD